MKRSNDGRYSERGDGPMFEGFYVYYDAKGYPIIWVDGKDIKIHVFVWEREHGKKPGGYEIHHKDYDKKNYSLANLELLSHSDHRKIHAGWIKSDGEWISKPCTGCNKVLPISCFYPRKGHTPCALCKKCHCAKTKDWASKNPNKRKEISLKYYYKNKKKGENNA